MTIKLEFQVIKDAVIENLTKEDPNRVVFFVGMQAYKVIDIIDHFSKETKFAVDIIDSAVKNNVKDQTLGNPKVPDSVIEATVQMFK